MNKKASIRDIPSISKTVNTINNYSAFKRVFPIIRPLFRIMGADVKKVDEALDKIGEIHKQFEEISNVPDRFNDLLSERGWIIYESMDFEVVKKALNYAESGDFDSAENELVSYYHTDTVRWQLRRMNAITAFRLRMGLAEKALLDYQEERYHASVPVILAIMDGLVNELHEKRRGFFSENVNLEAWDSISAHSKGLNTLTKILQTGRYKTTIDQISIPYRNGIMHGTDLGYDNRVVAAKTWAALFAIREWAIKAERGQLNPVPDKPEPTWKEIFKQLHDNEKDKILINQWKPRGIKVGVSIPSFGEPDLYPLGTPERKLSEFLFYWKRKNYGYMAKCASTLFGALRVNPGDIRDVYGSKNLLTYNIIKIIDEAPAITEIETKIVFKEFDEDREQIINFRFLNSDNSGNPAVLGKTDAEWGLVNWQL